MLSRKIYKIVTICMMLSALNIVGCGNKEVADVVTDSGQAQAMEAIMQTEATPSAVETYIEDDSQAEDTDNQQDELIPAVRIISNYNYIEKESDDLYQCYAVVSVEGLQLLSDEYEELEQTLHAHNVQMMDNASWYIDEVQAIADKDDGSMAKGSNSWRYDNKATITRADATVLSCRQECYSYMGQSDSRSITTGYSFEVKSGKELSLWDVVLSKDAFSEAVINALTDSNESEYYIFGWEEYARNAMKSGEGMTWYLEDDAIEVVFANDVVEFKSEVSVEIPYSECKDLVKEEYLKNTDNSCHMIDDYGEYCLEYSFDADGDGKDELLQIDTDIETDEDHYVLSTTPVILFGRDKNSLLPIYGDAVDRITGSYVMKDEYGRYYLYMEVTRENDYHSLLIYDLSNPDGGARFMGENHSGAFWGFLPSNPEQIYITERVNVMGTYAGYTQCHIGTDGQLESYGDPEYQLFNYDSDKIFEDCKEYNEATFFLTLNQDIEADVFDADHEGEIITLSAGTELYPYACDTGSYMVFSLANGQYTILYYDQIGENDWERKIKGIPEMELFEYVPYAG